MIVSLRIEGDKISRYRSSYLFRFLKYIANIRSYHFNQTSYSIRSKTHSDGEWVISSKSLRLQLRGVTSHILSYSPNNPLRVLEDITDNHSNPIPNNPDVCKGRLAGSQRFFVTLPVCFLPF